ncbi:hypothetical protein BC940DRAFT_231167 [Gongronella butleri]|nr:hypothetical protein BC940DRAFT_231167 [Gongronella butleri]
MADPDLARQLAEGHKVLSRLETEFSAKPPVPTALHAIQVRALAQFPGFLQTYSQPVIVNATVLKLADWFRTTNNVVRMHVYKVLKAMTRDQLAKVINIEETAKRLLPVTSSNDPVARTLTLRTLGCLASILGSNLNVQFGIQKATDRFEMEAAIWASDEICSQAASFLPVIFGRITALLTRSLSLSSSSDALSLKLECQLIHMLRHMHGNLAIAAQAKYFCVQLLEDRRDDETLVVALLRALSTFATFAIMYQAEQIDRLMHYALSDPRRRVQQTALQELKRLINDAPMDVDPFVVRGAILQRKGGKKEQIGLSLFFNHRYYCKDLPFPTCPSTCRLTRRLMRLSMHTGRHSHRWGPSSNSKSLLLSMHGNSTS